MGKQFFKVGDTVYDCIRHGDVIGKVINVNYALAYPIQVHFEYGGIDSYAADGKFSEEDVLPSLSFTKYTLSGFSQERPFDYNDYAGKWGFFWDEGEEGCSSHLNRLSRYVENNYFPFKTITGGVFKRFKPLTPELKQLLIEQGIINE